MVPFIAGPLVAAFAAWAVSAGAAAAATLLALAPILLIGAAIGALAVAWANDWGGIQGHVSNAVKIIQPIIEGLIETVVGIVDAIAPIVEDIGAILGDVVANFDEVAATIGTTVAGIIDFFVGPEGLVGKVDRAGRDIIGFITSIPAAIIKAGQDFVGAAESTVNSLIDGFVSLPGKLLDTITSAFRTAFENLRIDIGPFHISGRSGITIDLPTIDLPSFDVGSYNIPRDMLAVVHKGEMILPQGLATSVRAGESSVGGGGGSRGTSVFAPTLNVSGADDPDQWAATYVRSVARRLRREGLIA